VISRYHEASHYLFLASLLQLHPCRAHSSAPYSSTTSANILLSKWKVAQGFTLGYKNRLKEEAKSYKMSIAQSA
jgi:hypothetical protein